MNVNPWTVDNYNSARPNREAQRVWPFDPVFALALMLVLPGMALVMALVLR